MNKSEIATIISAGTAIVLAFIAFNQSMILSTEFETQNRPWIGVLGWEEYEENKLQVMFQNFGKIPNKSGELHWGIGNELMPRDALYRLDNPIDIGTLMPNQAKGQKFPSLTEEMVASSKNGTPLYIGIRIDYDYLDGKEGQYGLVILYLDGKFSIEDNWSK